MVYFSFIYIYIYKPGIDEVSSSQLKVNSTSVFKEEILSKSAKLSISLDPLHNLMIRSCHKATFGMHMKKEQKKKLEKILGTKFDQQHFTSNDCACACWLQKNPRKGCYSPPMIVQQHFTTMRLW